MCTHFTRTSRERECKQKINDLLLMLFWGVNESVLFVLKIANQKRFLSCVCRYVLVLEWIINQSKDTRDFDGILLRTLSRNDGSICAMTVGLKSKFGRCSCLFVWLSFLNQINSNIEVGVSRYYHNAGGSQLERAHRLS